MSGVAQMIIDNPAATAFGAAGLACQLAWPLFRSQRKILAVQFGIGADYSLHYALLGATSGAGVAALGAAQTALRLLAGERPWLRWAGLGFLPIVAAICWATWCGPASACALAAVTLIMVGRMQDDTLRLRLFMLAAAPFGMGYDILVGAAPALIGGIASAIIAVIALFREIRARQGAVRREFPATDAGNGPLRPRHGRPARRLFDGRFANRTAETVATA
ncbi:MAG: YgjV family protein [Bauldia sp.]|nr:YgjV family protein [Bauldia sp.]